GINRYALIADEKSQRLEEVPRLTKTELDEKVIDVLLRVVSEVLQGMLSDQLLQFHKLINTKYRECVVQLLLKHLRYRPLQTVGGCDGGLLHRFEDVLQ